jgi:leucyl-tRNA synthetase
MKRYNPTEIEPYWQQKWEQDGTYEVDFNDHTKPKYTGFSMLPGITGAGIHIGHGRTFQFSDIKVRFKRQQGYNAYHPIGWDSFGLPVENYAIKVGKKPREAHDEAKANFIKQLKRLGFSYDWSKEISTADPSYYRWTQWIFNKLFEHDLAYQKVSAQWWCEHDSTVLANEQVINGRCWRCNNLVVKRNLKQWFFKITEYADEMLEATDELDWTPMVKTMQKNWIGKSEGAEVIFKIYGSDECVTVFTTRPDTLYGATFLVIAPEHELISSLTNDAQHEAVESYVKQAQAASEIERMDETREKTGVFTGSYAINPLNDEKIPIWTADYVLSGYGTGAIMAVPAHDERDGAFATKFDLPIKQVVAPELLDQVNPPREGKENTDRQVVMCLIKHPAEDSYVTLRWNKFKWHNFVMGGIEGGEDIETAARREISEETGFTDMKLIDVLPIKMNSKFYAAHKDLNRNIYTQVLRFQLNSLDTVETKKEAHEDFETEWTPVDKLSTLQPVAELDYILRWLKGESMVYHGDGILINSGPYTGSESADAREQIVAHLVRKNAGQEKTSYKMRDWLISRQRYWGAPIPIIHCEHDGAVAVPDDQLPVILPDVEDYKPTGGHTSVLASVEDWVNVACPKCGGPAKRETDTMDGYACSSWYFLRYLDPFNDKQSWDPKVEEYWGPVDFYNGADHAVAHLLYSRFWMRFFFKLGLVSRPEPFKRMMYNAYILAPDGTKMSKSKGNVIDPLEIMDSGYGADSLRVYEMFIAPYDQDAPWDTRGVPGTYRFLNRVWTLVQDFLEASSDQQSDEDVQILERTAHKIAKKVTEDIELDKFNTAVSSMMETVNTLYKIKMSTGVSHHEQWRFALETLLQTLAPFAPHISEELWHQLGHEDSIHIDHWPVWNEAILKENTLTLAVQVNGKLRGEITVSSDASKETVETTALAQDNVIKTLEGATPKRIIYVPKRLVNIVL